ncbi:Protein of unknown function (DUF2927) [Rhodovulum imhoffii]|uniref:DUF2927 family protein n=1 Tax=Rhodovulum imhoffii TaxID=365340 RepID=A0A2T5BW19_9RHOB|nr:DUF2927 domain-containing protein [Rhodovulum imhoffii]MBK5935197.1 hypothetical protein [Rhodovulum imhoffii]PTN03835.1 Protein of unknown function (DUF2927) [Rhodovulum imhoffii]
MRSARRLIVLGLVLPALAACSVAPLPDPPAPRPLPRPEETPAPEPSAESEEIRRYFATIEKDLKSRGLLRTDNGQTDAPFSSRNLVENFLRIALYDEYTTAAGALVARETESRLRRWETPIRMGLIFGPSVPEAQQRTDRASVAAYARRLARLTGLSISLTSPAAANYHILVLNEDERRHSAGILNRILPGIDPTAVRTIQLMPRSTLCLVFSFSRGRDSVYSDAIAVIRGEHPPTLRLSCYHEELAQGLGLANDSPAARPSIFNDDEEFALLTRHDELLLQILYDRRLRPGMTEDQARPIVETIVAELLGGES